MSTAEQIFLRQIVIRVGELHTERRKYRQVIRRLREKKCRTSVDWILEKELEELNDSINLLTSVFNNENEGLTL